MKKICYSIFYLIAVVIMAACTHEEDDLFGNSSAIRADEAIKANLAVLTGAENGWLMEYFPEANQAYGGYNILLKFGADGKVEASNELYESTDVVSSLYSIKQSAGIVLSFDTYNEIFHFFSDPSDPSGVGGNGYGLEGDYDFLMLEASPEKVLLKGKKAGGQVILTPMKGSWSEYLSNIQAASSAMKFSKYLLTVNGQEIPVTTSNRTLTFTFEQDDNAQSVTASYIITPSGYKFYKPVIVNGTTLNGFTFDAANEVFTETTDNNIKLVPVIPPLNEQFVSGDWFIAYSQLGKFAQVYFSYCKTNYLDPQGENLNYAFMGSALYGEFGFNFNSSGYAGLLGYDYELIGEDKISLQFNFTGAGNGVWYHNNMGFHYLLNPFGYSSARIFTLTTDNPANPSYITLTEDANPDNSMTLFANQVNYPFRN